MKTLHLITTTSMKRLILAAFFATAAMFATAASASAQLVGINFGNSGDAAYAGVGVLGETFTLGITGDGSSVAQNDSVTNVAGSGVNLSLTTVDGDYFATRGDTTTNLYAGDLESRKNDTITLTLSGLTAGDSYNVAFYGGNFGVASDHRAVGLTINGAATTGLTGATNPSPAFVAGDNYYEATSVVAQTGGVITLVATTGSASSYNPINGVGIQFASAPVAVPEPTTWGMLAGGVGLLAGVQALRRRNA